MKKRKYTKTKRFYTSLRTRHPARAVSDMPSGETAATTENTIAVSGPVFVVRLADGKLLQFPLDNAWIG